MHPRFLTICSPRSRTGWLTRSEARELLGPWRRQDGFTLIELLVTLALITLIAVLSLPYISRGRSAADLASDARVLASHLRAARETALAARSDAAVIIDLVHPGVRGPGDVSEYRFTAAERVRVTNAKGVVTGDSAQIMFGSDGGSSGGVIVLESRARVRVVSVEWLTGAVSISETVR